MIYPNEEFPWKGVKNDGLQLFIHGLRGSPSDWTNYMDHIRLELSNTVIFAPNVLKTGNVSLKEAAEPILYSVREYIKEHPGNRINIFGTSNGSRIATYIENELSSKELGDSSLNFISVAGVLRGTKLIDFLEKYRLTVFAGLHAKLQEEFKWESDTAQTLLHQWIQKQQLWKENNKNVKHLYCSTLEDELVWPRHSSHFHSFFTVTDHAIFSGHTHMSIIEGARSTVPVKPTLHLALSYLST